VSRQKKEEKITQKVAGFQAKRNKYSLDLYSTLCQDKVEKEKIIQKVAGLQAKINLPF